MQTIELHIIELLKKHDCVIVPDFGGFLLNAQPARISAAMHEILPPSKDISFNRSLVANDGLLVNLVSQKENVNYLTALSTVNKFSASCKAELQASGNLELKGIGSFSIGSEGNWQFTPAITENFLFSSFGLSALQLSPVEATQTRSNNREIKSVTVSLPSVPKRKSWLKGVAVVASLLIIATISVLFFNNYSDKKLISFSKDKSSNSASTVSINPNSTSENIVVAEDLAETADTNTENQFNSGMQSAGFSFYVIGGSFSKEKNAKTFAEQLEKKGFKSEILNNENGLFRVAYHKEIDSLSADQFLKGIKKENQSAWILKW